jgi:hypothetical protein
MEMFQEELMSVLLKVNKFLYRQDYIIYEIDLSLTL